MPRFTVAVACIAWLAGSPGVALSQPADKEKAAGPAYPVIVAMAQQFVLEHYRSEKGGERGARFSMSEVHPRNGEPFWAVIGAFQATDDAGDYQPHAFGAAMRLVCDSHMDQDCWRLEQLVIDKKVIVDLKPEN